MKMNGIFNVIMLVFIQIEYFVSYKNKNYGAVGKIDYALRTWNLVCWTFNFNQSLSSVYYNSIKVGDLVLPTHDQQGIIASENASKYLLILGQEPDSYLDPIGFDREQAFLGNISGLNLWDRMLTLSEIEDLTRCRTEAQGNAVAWKRNNYKVVKATVYTIKNKDYFCARKPIWIFFPGRRVVSDADRLCKAHGGEVVTPSNEEENSQVRTWYLHHKDECYDELGDTIGWLGASRNVLSGSSNLTVGYENYNM